MVGPLACGTGVRGREADKQSGESKQKPNLVPDLFEACATEPRSLTE
jgi:hypothetical protein